MPNDLFGRQVHNAHKVLTVTGVKNRCVPPIRMQRDVNRKIPESQLPACRVKGPLIGQEHGTIALRARATRSGHNRAVCIQCVRQPERSRSLAAGKNNQAQKAGN